MLVMREISFINIGWTLIRPMFIMIHNKTGGKNAKKNNNRF